MTFLAKAILRKASEMGDLRIGLGSRSLLHGW